MATGKTIQTLWITLTVCFILLFSSSTIGAQNRDSRAAETGPWRAVDSLMSLQMPRSALPLVNQIYRDAARNQQHATMVRAVMYKLAIASSTEEDHTLQSVDILKKEIAQSTHPPVTAIWHSMLAEVYWRHYGNNYWRQSGRSVTSGYDEPDYRLWDLQRLAREIIKHYELSLADKELLQKVQIKHYHEIISKGKSSPVYRPTLYDFLAHRALEFFTSDLSGLSRPAEQFLLDKEEYFAGEELFCAINIQTSDSLSLVFRAIRIYQEMTRFHLNAKDPRALLEVTIDRLNYAKRLHSNNIDGTALYLAQLENLSALYQNHPSYPWIRYHVARNHYQRHTANPMARNSEGKLFGVIAYEICNEAISRFPEGDGANDCRSIIRQLTAKSLTIETRQVIAAGTSMMYLTTYKNIPKIYYRLIKLDHGTFQSRERHETDLYLAWLRQQKPLHAWSLDTKDPGDFTEHAFEYGTPVLDPGFYVLVASPSPGFGTENNTVMVNTFQVSNIAYLSRHDPQGNLLMLITDRTSGAPLNKIQVIASARVYDYSMRQWTEKYYNTFISNAQGVVTIPPAHGNTDFRSLNFVLADSRGDTLRSLSSTFLRGNDLIPERETYQTHLFLDRKIYRPGQIVYFKGIVVRSQGKVKSVATDYKTRVQLLDVNRKVVHEIMLTTNEFGSFQGSFILPATGLTGTMVLKTDHGSEYFSMEEYKRPKFSVQMLPYTGTGKPGEEVEVQGKAQAYAGFALTGSNVKYRVTRQVQYPYKSRGRFFPWVHSPDVEISQGNITIGEDGLFRIVFTASPDPSVSVDALPVFYYTVHVDVTDLNGETQSARSSFAIGYTTILLSDKIPAEVERSKGYLFPVSATNLNQQPMEVNGTWTLYRMEKPAKPTLERRWRTPDTWLMEEVLFRKLFPYEPYEAAVQADDQKTRISQGIFSTGGQGMVDLSFLAKATSGQYLIVFEAADPSGQTVQHEKSFLLFGASEKRIPVPDFFSLRILNQKAEPGEEVVILVGSSEQVHLRYSVELDGRVLKEEWLTLKGKQQAIRIRIEEHHRGGLAVHFATTFQNRTFTKTQIITVPHSDKKLDIQFATFRDKLQPGETEQYTITVRGSKGDKVLAEMAAGMYDASLDAFSDNGWYLFPFESNRVQPGWGSIHHALFGTARSRTYGAFHEKSYRHRAMEFDRLNWFYYSPGYGFRHRDRPFLVNEEVLEDAITFQQSLPMMAAYKVKGEDIDAEPDGDGNYQREVSDSISSAAGLLGEGISAVPIRTNFNETAFFFPQLKTDMDGNVVFSYTIPESLTAWKLMVLAHTRDLKTGTVEKKLVTQKTLMVIPNAPRFFRAQDRITYTAKVTNLSTSPQTCRVTLHLTHGLTGEVIDAACRNQQAVQQITVAAGQSGVVSWELYIPEGIGAITYRVTAVSGDYSDGEEMTIPVLTNRMLVTEGLPLWVNGRNTKTFNLTKLMNSGSSSTLTHHKLTLEYTSAPAWYAIQALPYLMEFPYECSEQLFSRFFANAMATHILNSTPKIKAVFDTWRTITPDALLSNLEKNQELKALLLEETPWVRDAATESDRKQRVALLFDLNRMSSEMQTVLTKLKEQQTSNGGWPWFKGGPESWYITQHITTGIGRLHVLNVAPFSSHEELKVMAKRSILFLDKQLEEHYAALQRLYKDKPKQLNDNHLNQLLIQYLSTRAIFTEVFPMNKTTMEAFNWLKRQVMQHWTSQEIMMKGHIALALNRLGERTMALQIMKSLKERSMLHEELGRYWPVNPGYYWYEAPIERHALLIEAFDEVAGDKGTVEELKTWLLKQKQTTNWKTTKATAEACYALLMRGGDWLSTTEPARITLGGVPVDPFRDGATSPEAGTGYFKVSWDGAAVTPSMGEVTVTGNNDGPSWGGLYWQYFENLDKITPHATPLQLNKLLFVEEMTPSGVVIRPVTDGTTLKVGDRIVVRIELRVDRDMEFVHMKDMRASTFEPVTTRSGYRWQGGLGYYESPRDAAVNFFFDHLRKGTYLFEYKLFATHAGEFSNGITTIQCMYAPEFTSHSEGIRVNVE